MAHRIAALVAVAVFLGLGGAYAQEVGSGPAAADVTYFSAAAAFITSNAASPSAGDYGVGSVLNLKANLVGIEFAIAVFVSLLIAGVIASYASRHRRRDPLLVGRVLQAPEIGWTVIPFMISMVIFACGARATFGLNVPVGGAVTMVTVPEVTGIAASQRKAMLSGAAPERSRVSAGAKVFQDLRCNACHRPGAQGLGPPLEGLFGKTVRLQSGETMTVDEAYVRESIVNPSAKVVAGFQPIMPTFQHLVTEERLLELIEYIKSLKAPRQLPTR